MPVGTLTSKGQITIPIEIRRRLGLKEGDHVEFVIEADRTVIRPLRREESGFTKWVGIAPAFHTKEEVNAWVREMRDED